MQQHPLVKKFEARLIRFGQIWLDLGEILAKLRRNLIRFGKNQNLVFNMNNIT